MSLQVAFGESVEFEIEFRRRRTWNPERIELRGHVSTHPVVTDQLIDALLQYRAGRLFRDGTVPGCSWRIENARRLERWRQALVLRKAVPFRQSLKISPPVRWDGLRIAQVSLIQAFDKLQAEAVRKLRLFHKQRISKRRW